MGETGNGERRRWGDAEMRGRGEGISINRRLSKGIPRKELCDDGLRADDSRRFPAAPLAEMPPDHFGESPVGRRKRDLNCSANGYGAVLKGRPNLKSQSVILNQQIRLWKAGT